MSNEVKPGVRSAPVGSDSGEGKGESFDSWSAQLAKEREVARKASEAADLEARFQDTLRREVPPAFAANERWVGLRRQRDASDTRIQPDECWRIARPSGRF